MRRGRTHKTTSNKRSKDQNTDQDVQEISSMEATRHKRKKSNTAMSTIESSGKDINYFVKC
jgi:hypothetical protein